MMGFLLTSCDQNEASDENNQRVVALVMTVAVLFVDAGDSIYLARKGVWSALEALASELRGETTYVC